MNSKVQSIWFYNQLFFVTPHFETSAPNDPKKDLEHYISP